MVRPVSHDWSDKIAIFNKPLQGMAPPSPPNEWPLIACSLELSFELSLELSLDLSLSQNSSGVLFSIIYTDAQTSWLFGLLLEPKRNKGMTFSFSCDIQCSAWNNCLKHELHCYFDIYCWQSWKYVSHMKMHLCLDLFKSYTHKVTEKFIFAVNSHIAVNSGGPRA